MRRFLALMSAAGIGAGLMYLLDPDRGKRRRGLLRNKAVHIKHIAGDTAGKAQRDVRNHLRGVLAQLESLFVDNGPASNEVVEARVRSRLGRIVSHPRAIKVKAVDGLVILTGHIQTGELHPLLDTVIDTRGVKNIENHLEVYEQASDTVRSVGELHAPAIG